ncbi:hypothetical protein [Actinocorallia sp. A-T 12471]|uniref:hypothetical protein n=1 Tax=Actinocorallia sp. A-T 12471 TaxID=3089813 RepID=UPI0029CD882C|nr:hypothetical protein [Actinocorallia sp. A-T 12471]MDX6741087.1 hypothetical protein [Actinocorallia sp. A-T 12471]
MTGTKRAKGKKRIEADVEAFRWDGPGGARRGSDAPVAALLALTGTLVVARTDGTTEALPVAEGPGPLLEGARRVWRTETPLNALAWGFGEVLGAAGDRIVRLGPDGSLRDGPAFDGVVGALCARVGKVFAVAGDAVHTLDRQGEEWAIVRSTPLPFDGCHDLDVDRTGRYALAVRKPSPEGVVVDLETGGQVGAVAVAKWEAKDVADVYARFSPVADNVYRFASRSDEVDKLAKLGRSGRKITVRPLLGQPSAWCTPVASSPDGRHVASRQSGVGVLVWDLATERHVLFAELDDADRYDKFARSASRAPVSARALGDGVKVTRWAHLPVPDGDTTAVAVAPGARYAAVGGADGSVVVIDGATRRIEHGDGTVRQPALRTRVIRCDPERKTYGVGVFGDGVWLGHAYTGATRVTAVELATGEPRDLDITGITPWGCAVSGDTLAVRHADGVRGYDRASLAPLWESADLLPDHDHHRFHDGLLLGRRITEDKAVVLARYDPRTGTRAADLTLACDGRPLRPESIAYDPRTGDVAVRADCEGKERWHLCRADAPTVHLPVFETVIGAQGVGITRDEHGWHVLPFRDPDTPVASGLTTAGLALVYPRLHVDVARGLAVGQDFNRRLGLWRLDGSAFRLFDGLGEAEATGFAFTDDGLWLHSYKGDSLYLLNLPEI